MTAARLDLRIPAEMKERWQAEAQAQGLTLTAFIVRKVEGQRLPPELESLVAQRVEDVLEREVPRTVSEELQAVVESLLEEKLEPALLSSIPELLRRELEEMRERESGWPIPAD